MPVTIERSAGDPRGFRLTTELVVPASREQVFEFFADAFQLQTITPPWVHFSVQTPPPIEIRAGTVIDYKLRLHGVPVRWRSRISHWEPPFQFVDEQLRGPYRYWKHRHGFEELSEGTLVRDVVDYAVPLGLILHPLLVRRDLRRIFEFRCETISTLFTR